MYRYEFLHRVTAYASISDPSLRAALMNMSPSTSMFSPMQDNFNWDDGKNSMFSPGPAGFSPTSPGEIPPFQFYVECLALRCSCSVQILQSEYASGGCYRIANTYSFI